MSKQELKELLDKFRENLDKNESNGQIPRGERGDFLKTTITISSEMLTELRALGMKRKAAKQKDTDTSALIREAIADLLVKDHEIMRKIANR